MYFSTQGVWRKGDEDMEEIYMLHIFYNSRIDIYIYVYIYIYIMYYMYVYYIHIYIYIYRAEHPVVMITLGEDTSCLATTNHEWKNTLVFLGLTIEIVVGHNMRTVGRDVIYDIYVLFVVSLVSEVSAFRSPFFLTPSRRPP